MVITLWCLSIYDKIISVPFWTSQIPNSNVHLYFHFYVLSNPRIYVPYLKGQTFCGWAFLFLYLSPPPQIGLIIQSSTSETTRLLKFFVKVYSNPTRIYMRRKKSKINKKPNFVEHIAFLFIYYFWAFWIIDRRASVLNHIWTFSFNFHFCLLSFYWSIFVLSLSVSHFVVVTF